MTKREIAKLCCRVLAIYALIHALQPLQQSIAHIGLVITYWQNPGLRAQFWASATIVIFPIIQILLAVWLWRKAGVVAAIMTGYTLQDHPDEPDLEPIRADVEAVQAVVLSTLGIWVLIDVAPHIMATAIETLVVYLLAGQNAAQRASLVISNEIWIWGCRLAVAFWLIFGARGLVGVLSKVRRRKLNQAPLPVETQTGGGP